MKRITSILLALTLGLAAALGHAEGEKKAPPAPLTAGEVTKVDKEARKLTIKHGPIENLKMPPMTMVFRVKDAAMLEGLAPGSKIRFRAEEADGGMVVTRLQVAGK